MRKASLAVVAGLALTAMPAQAAILNGADFRQGPVVAAGLTGLSLDYAMGPVSLGTALRREMPDGMALSARALGRFYETPSNAAAVVAGLWFDPGVSGGRAYLVPDVGIALAHRFVLHDSFGFVALPVVLRASVTFTAAEQRFDGPVPVAPVFGAPPGFRGNVFQRLALGPNSTVGVAFLVHDHVELTVGSGTIAGVRLKF